MKQVFKGKFQSTEEILQMLKRQGLLIEDEDRAAHILKNVSYTRLKSYMVPFMEDRKSHKFKYGATFEQVYALYGFDRRFRELIFHEMEKVEISIRTQMAFVSAGSDHGYWYTNRKYFQNNAMHKSIMYRIKGEINRTDNDGIKNFQEKYSNEFPPCWLALEALSMGTLSTIYSELNPGKLRRSIAEYYGVSDTVFISWLHHLVYIRNNCAHHNRLWNKTLSIRPMVPVKPDKYFPPLTTDDTAHVYATLCMIKFLQDTVKPTNTFSVRLQALLDNYPIVDPAKMGFPTNWREDPLWKYPTL
ncbi:MAG: Abi family protein [Bacteroidales bacterium]|nr:Abi family protein [Bacteroidales bacterium]